MTGGVLILSSLMTLCYSIFTKRGGDTNRSYLVPFYFLFYFTSYYFLAFCSSYFFYSSIYFYCNCSSLISSSYLFLSSSSYFFCNNNCSCSFLLLASSSIHYFLSSAYFNYIYFCFNFKLSASILRAYSIFYKASSSSYYFSRIKAILTKTFTS